MPNKPVDQEPAARACRLAHQGRFRDRRIPLELALEDEQPAEQVRVFLRARRLIHKVNPIAWFCGSRPVADPPRLVVRRPIADAHQLERCPIGKHGTELVLRRCLGLDLRVAFCRRLRTGRWSICRVCSDERAGECEKNTDCGKPEPARWQLEQPSDTRPVHRAPPWCHLQLLTFRPGFYLLPCDDREQREHPNENVVASCSHPVILVHRTTVVGSLNREFRGQKPSVLHANSKWSYH